MRLLLSTGSYADGSRALTTGEHSLCCSMDQRPAIRISAQGTCTVRLQQLRQCHDV